MTEPKLGVVADVSPGAELCCGAERASYADLWARARTVASQLPAPTSHGGLRGEVLLVCSDRYHFTVGLMASWIAGHAVALPPSHRPAVLAEIGAGARVLARLHDGELDDGIDLRAHTASPGAEAAPIAAQPADVHLSTLYTSGSTGSHQPSPKRAHELLGEVQLLHASFGDGISRVLCTVPPRHIYGLLFSVLLPLRAGACFVRETPLLADVVRDLIRRHGVDTLVAVPAHLESLSSGDLAGLSGLRRLFSSGAPLPERTFARLREAPGLSVHEVLGSTETGGIGHREAPGAPFTPFPGLRVSSDGEGHLLLSSPHLSAELPQPHRCDDLVELLSDGRFRHLGRVGDVLKIGGTRVSLRQLESRVRRLSGVEDVVALAREVPGARGQELLLVVVAPGWDAGRMRAALGEWLEPVALPRRYRFVDALPRESTGKLRRAALLELFDAAAATGDPNAFEREVRERTPERARLHLRPGRDLLYFRGHFDGWPVLPGVAQLGRLAVHEAREAWPELQGLRRVRHLKFKRPIAPEERLELELVRKDAARVDFSIVHEGALCTSGTLLFGELERADGGAQ